MLDSTAPIPLDYQLPGDAYWHLIRALCRTLPSRPGASPDDLQKREHAAMAGVAALAPGNAVEVSLAAQFVAASEQWNHCLRLADAPEPAPAQPQNSAGLLRRPAPWPATCRAEALSMMRQANSALRLLVRLQEARRKLETDNVACDRAARAEHVAIALMAEALKPEQSPDVAAIPPTVEPAFSPAPAEQPEPEPAPAAGEKPSPACGRAQGEGTEPVPLEEPDALAEAEHYAVLYPDRAALIRRLGRLPDDPAFGPPDDDLVQALIAGSSPTLAALDRAFADVHAA